MAKVLNLVDIQGADLQNKRPASSIADIPVPKRPAVSHMSIHQEGSTPRVSVSVSLYLLLLMLYLYM